MPEIESITDSLRRAINDSGMTFLALERETGVIRQSLMPFARGECSISLDTADKLAKYFELKLSKNESTEIDEDTLSWRGPDTMAGAIRSFIQRHPNSTIDEVIDAVSGNIRSFSPNPHMAISQCLSRIVRSGKIVKEFGRYYMADGVDQCPKYGVPIGKLDYDNRTPTTKLIRECVRQHPGIKRNRVADFLEDKIDTRSPNKRLAIFASLSQMRAEGKLIERQEDNTWWAPEHHEKMINTSIGKSEHHERMENEKIQGIVSVVKFAESVRCRPT